MEDFYGEMSPPKSNAKPALVSCSKCGGRFSSAKRHSVLKLESAHFAPNTKGVVEHKILATDATYRFCPSCLMKFKHWISLP